LGIAASAVGKGNGSAPNAQPRFKGAVIKMLITVTAVNGMEITVSVPSSTEAAPQGRDVGRYG
jgi:hypothetical protein